MQLIGQNDVSGCCFFLLWAVFMISVKLMIFVIWVTQTAFSDMYLGYTTTLASFLSLEFDRLNQAENSQKAQVRYSLITSFAPDALRYAARCFSLFVCLLTERPGGEGGDETAVPAVGTCVSCTQLPEPHPGEAAAGSASAGHRAEDTRKLLKIAK